MSAPLLVVGKIFVDFTLAPVGTDNKLRLGGIAHAARGLWAIGKRFAVAAVCPAYLRDSARRYLDALGCVEFVNLGDVRGAPNVIVIADQIELAHQGYEDLLRDERATTLNDVRGRLSVYKDAVVFPGCYDLRQLLKMLPNGARAHLDIAYDVQCIDDLTAFCDSIETVLISTSSDLFHRLAGDGLRDLLEALEPFAATIVVKENRGGARVFRTAQDDVEFVPSLLGRTANSVGVGDVFSAAYAAFLPEGCTPASFKAARVSSAYAQSTDPDVFKKYARRSLKLSVDQMRALGGTSLPWEARRDWPIYLAAPDFSYAERRPIDEAVRSLEYHNFDVRRPVLQNRELPLDAPFAELSRTFHADIGLLAECSMVFAIPTARDPGTLVEIGLAMEMGKPVVVFDPQNECRNTMVVAGATCYAQSLDECLNAVFTTLSDMT